MALRQDDKASFVHAPEKILRNKTGLPQGQWAEFAQNGQGGGGGYGLLQAVQGGGLVALDVDFQEIKGSQAQIVAMVDNMIAAVDRRLRDRDMTIEATEAAKAVRARMAELQNKASNGGLSHDEKQELMLLLNETKQKNNAG